MKKPLGPLWTRYLSGSESIVAKLAFTSGFIPWGMGMKLPREQKSAVKPRYSVQFSRSVVSDSFVTPWTIAHQAPLSTRFPKLIHVNVWQKPPQYSKVISLQFKKEKRILEWVAISSSRVFSWPRDWTCVSCLAGRFFTTEPPGKASLALTQTNKTCIE